MHLQKYIKITYVRNNIIFKIYYNILIIIMHDKKMYSIYF